MATARALSPRASPTGLPNSRTISAVSSSACSATASAALCKAWARAGAGVAVHSRCASRARSAALATPPAARAGSSATTSSGRCGETLVIWVVLMDLLPPGVRRYSGRLRPGCVCGHRGEGFSPPHDDGIGERADYLELAAHDDDGAGRDRTDPGDLPRGRE